ncbi:MAG: hypothetical protein J5673_01295 [Candidatus Methanomethylophilaceae archaeon]|nr:hypothetical protein [Candidatus Methanomethylophilaceae archaeon]
MLIMARSMDYPELLGKLSGKRVLIWTCNTCARLCNNIGGTESSERLAEKLREDGVEVVGAMSISASCLERKVMDRKEEAVSEKPDLILSLTCSIGSSVAEKVFGRDIINPIDTFGYGLLTGDGVPVLVRDGQGIPVDALSGRASPFI